MSGRFDVVVIGAGAAGMMAAAVAGQRGRSVLLLDHARRIGEKIRISGGGRCNFTNLHTTPQNFLSDQPRFCSNALRRYTPRDFLGLMRRHGIAWHEKHRGQLFCDHSSVQVIGLLQAECAAGNVTWRTPCKIGAITRAGDDFVIDAEGGVVHTRRLVVATGGLSIPAIGATDLGYRIARQFGLAVVPPRPALVPLTFPADVWKPFVELAGVALEVCIATGTGKTRMRFDEDLLFTHRGLSGPAVLQISSYWQPDTPLVIDLAPTVDLAAELVAAKSGARQNLATVLHAHLPRSLAQGWLATRGQPELASRKIAEIGDKALREIAASLKDWHLLPAGTEGWRKAEVTAGGVDVAALSPDTLEARAVPGLHFVGEVVDVTGWLGGYNFQWAWSSGVAAGRAV